MQRMMTRSILLCCVALSLSLVIIFGSNDARAEQRVVGVVIDYWPRGESSGKAFISIRRDGESIPVKEHEILKEGDRLVFAEDADPKAFVKALIGAGNVVTLNRQSDRVPETSWPFLQSIIPKLLAAYHWVNATAGVDNSGPRNAISRGALDEIDFAVLPKAQKTLIISSQSKSPLWIGWAGGIPPFKVSLAENGKVRQLVDVCKNGSETGCVRETIIGENTDATGPLTLSIESSDGSSWSGNIESDVIAEEKGLAAPEQLGSLGVFLHATGLLDRDPGTYVLESARELATISGDYPPARTLLDEIKSGQVP
jgi:hypothetical protein